MAIVCTAVTRTGAAHVHGWLGFGLVHPGLFYAWELIIMCGEQTTKESHLIGLRSSGHDVIVISCTHRDCPPRVFNPLTSEVIPLHRTIQDGSVRSFDAQFSLRHTYSFSSASWKWNKLRLQIHSFFQLNAYLNRNWIPIFCIYNPLSPSVEYTQHLTKILILIFFYKKKIMIAVPMSR